MYAQVKTTYKDVASRKPHQMRRPGIPLSQIMCIE